jgi:murein DD-endopeptidase MepM/ murein hydrolase activator NlpD
MLASTATAQNDDAGRFSAAAKKLIQEINSNDLAAIQAGFDAGMQNLLPPDKSTQFFQGIVAAKGKLKSVGVPQVAAGAAVMRVAAERGAWEFTMKLDAAGKISYLLVKPAAAEAPAAVPSRRFNKVVSKLIQSINGGDVGAIDASFDAQMQQALPPEKAKQFFKELYSGYGKLKKADAPKIDGDTAVVRVTAERGEMDFQITLDKEDKISALQVTPAEGGAGNGTTAPVAGASGSSSAVPRSRVPMQLPFRGEWFVFWGGDNEKVNYHVSTPGQRRAADLVMKGADGRSHRDTGKRNEDYFVFGQQILAAAAGTVVTAVDGVPDNVPGSMNPLCAVGNCLIIDQGSGEFAVYAHLQPGSLQVKRGEKVSQGQVLGLCGNSGNSSEPHLHFHLQDKATLQDGLGITPYFTNVSGARGSAALPATEYTFLQGDRIQTAGGK